MVSPERVVAQWYDASKERDTAQVVRRIEIRVSDVTCLLRSGKATVLIDSDGSFLPIYPEAYISPESLAVLDSLMQDLSSRVPVVAIEPLFDEEIALVDRFTHEGPSALQEGTIQPLPDYLSRLSLPAPTAVPEKPRQRGRGGTRPPRPAQAGSASAGNRRARWKRRRRMRLTNNDVDLSPAGSTVQKRKSRWVVWLIIALIFGIWRSYVHSSPKQTNIPHVTPFPTISVTVPTFSIPPFSLPTPAQTGQ